MVARGEIRLIDYEPARGSEANKRRPAIIVTNDATNDATSVLGRGVVTAIPLTTNLRKVLAFHVIITAKASGLTHDSKAQPEHIRAVDRSRVGELVGVVPPLLMRDVDDALRLHLDL